jgi:hypothetical protein
VRLKPLEDHSVRPINLPIGVWLPDRRPVNLDLVSVSELQELLACEVGPVVYDDGAGHIEPVDNVKEELDDLLGVGFGDEFHPNPLGELVHRDKQVSETIGRPLDKPDHVKAPDHERLGEGDGLKRLHWQVGLPSVELTPFTHADDLLHIAQRCWPVKTLAKGLAD